jgi:hypothetical protein
MNTDIDENDCIVIQTEGSEVGKRSAGSAGSTDPADAGASAPSQNVGEGAEDGRGGWAMVTRRKAKVGGIGSGSSPTAKTARVFASTSELERKRKAEQSLVDQVTALRELVTQLVEGQKEQKAQYDKQAELLKELVRESQGQQRTIAALRAAVEKNAQKPTYCEAVKGIKERGTEKARMATTGSSPTGSVKDQDHAIIRERTVSLDTGRTKAETTDYVVVKQKLQQGLDKSKVTEGLKIQFLRPGPGERVDVVFREKKDAEKARKYTGWATGQLPGTRVKGEEWFPVKCDMVAKLAVMDRAADDGKTLRQTLCQEFGKENTAEGIDFTAMKVHWLSKIDVTKKVGSLVIWLKNKIAADYLLGSGTAIFGATGAYCSKWEKRDDNLPCFNCNKYGHKQASCKAAPKCALCSGQHSRRNCTQPTKLKCPACSKEGHSVFDWQCQLHPSHWKYRGIQKAERASQAEKSSQVGRSKATTRTEANEREVDMTDVGDSRVRNE